MLSRFKKKVIITLKLNKYKLLKKLYIQDAPEIRVQTSRRDRGLYNKQLLCGKLRSNFNSNKDILTNFSTDMPCSR